MRSCAWYMLSLYIKMVQMSNEIFVKAKKICFSAPVGGVTINYRYRFWRFYVKMVG